MNKTFFMTQNINNKVNKIFSMMFIDQKQLITKNKMS